MNSLIAVLQSEVGVARTSDWLMIDQPMIDAFAEVTQDHQFIHVDPVAAAKTPFGGTIAHGFLILSMTSAMIESIDRPALPGVKMGINYGCDRLRFVAPVRSGSRIRTHATLIEFAERQPGQFQLTHDLMVEIEGSDRPALNATWLSLLVT